MNKTALFFEHALNNRNNSNNSERLVCIAENISISSCSSKVFANALFASPYGHIVFAMSKKPSEQEIRDVSEFIRFWRSDDVDRMCESFSYKKFGQASKVSDVMASHGYLRFSDTELFNSRMDRCFENSNFLFLSVS